MYRAYRHARTATASSRPGLSHAGHRGLPQGRLPQLVLEGKREYVALYNYGTTFWQGRNRADYPSIAKELKINLKDVATYFHAKAQKSKKADEYLEAARWYRTYLESFPDDPESFGTNYLLAETLYSAGDFSRAPPRSSRKTAYNYPRNPRSAAAAYAALGLVHQIRSKARPAAEKAEGAQADGGCSASSSARVSPEHPTRGRADARRRRHLRRRRTCSARSRSRTWCSRTSRRPTSRSGASRTPSSASRTSTSCSSPRPRRVHRRA